MERSFEPTSDGAPKAVRRAGSRRLRLMRHASFEDGATREARQGASDRGHENGRAPTHTSGPTHEPQPEHICRHACHPRPSLLPASPTSEAVMTYPDWRLDDDSAPRTTRSCASRGSKRVGLLLLPAPIRIASGGTASRPRRTLAPASRSFSGQGAELPSSCRVEPSHPSGGRTAAVSTRRNEPM
jgi:hypothetical protein